MPPEKPEKSEQEVASALVQRVCLDLCQCSTESVVLPRAVEAAVKADDLGGLLDAVGVAETKTFREEGFEKISDMVEAQVSDKDLKTSLGVKKLKARKAILRAIAMMTDGKDEL